jgi:hypothetical protein
MQAIYYILYYTLRMLCTRLCSTDVDEWGGLSRTLLSTCRNPRKCTKTHNSHSDKSTLSLCCAAVCCDRPGIGRVLRISAGKGGEGRRRTDYANLSVLGSRLVRWVPKGHTDKAHHDTYVPEISV